MPQAKDSTIEKGFCQCGCGGITKIAECTLKRLGWINGEPKPFLRYHRYKLTTTEQRFLKYVDQNGPIPENRPELGPCWLWLGCISRKTGYGKLTERTGVSIGAHRLGYEIAKGKIPEGLEIDHLCKVHACVNPDHLEAVTERENQLRGNSVSGVNSRKTHCAKGHPLVAGTSPSRINRRQCPICRDETTRRWQKANPERVAEIQRRHRLRQKEK
jgi:hypothetical protein